MSARWRKVWGDLRESPARTLLVGLAIAVGAAAVATTFTARTILLREVEASFQGSRPASAVLWLDAVDGELLAKVRELPGVAEADARRLVRARVRVAPDEWRPLLIFGVADFDNLRVSVFRPVSGDFPPRDGELLVERSSLAVLRVRVGGRLHVRAPGGVVRDLPVGGVVHDAGVAPGWQDHVGYAYATPRTLELLGQGSRLDELRVAINGDADRAEAARVAAGIAGWLNTRGREVQRIEIPSRRHPHADHVETLLTLLLIFSFLALILSGALTANLMAAVMAKQTRQVGIMKSTGATAWQVAELYLRLVFALSVVAVAVGIVLGTVLGRAYAGVAAEQLNLIVMSRGVPLWLFVVEALVGVGVPLLAAAVPVTRAARRPSREALQDAGIKPLGNKRSGRFFNSFSSNRRLTLSLRNTFRRPARTLLSLTALALGGAMLMTGVNVYSSLVRAVDESFARRGDSIEVRLLRPAPVIETLVNDINRIPGVRSVEAWGSALVSLGVSEDENRLTGTDRYSLLAPPHDSRLAHFKIVEGRLPAPDERGEITINRVLRDTEPNLSTGAEVDLIFAGRRTRVRVVGVVEEVAAATAYTNAATLEAVTGFSPEAVGALRLVTEAGTEGRVAAELEEVLADNDLLPTFLMTRGALRQSTTDHFLLLLFVLTAIAVCALIVGGLGLATSMSLNVLERRREIGVIRSIGATSRAVLWLILVEATAIATLSVILAVLASLPLSIIVGIVVGKHGLHVTLPFVVSSLAMLGWTVLAAVITLAACSFPVRSTLRQSVSEILAYE